MCGKAAARGGGDVHAAGQLPFSPAVIPSAWRCVPIEEYVRRDLQAAGEADVNPVGKAFNLIAR